MPQIFEPVTDKPDWKVYRILALGNENHINQTKEACLEAEHEVVPVVTIRAGMEFLETKDHVDLIVSEMHLEDESVFDFLRELKASNQHDVRFMMVCADTSSMRDSSAEAVKRAATIFGVDKCLLMKRFNAEVLAEEINKVLPKRLPLKEQ